MTAEQALEALDSMDDFARMTVGVDAHGPRETLRRFIEHDRARLAPQPLSVHRPCDKHAGLPIKFTTVAVPAVAVCLHCAEEQQ